MRRRVPYLDRIMGNLVQLRCSWLTASHVFSSGTLEEEQVVFEEILYRWYPSLWTFMVLGQELHIIYMRGRFVCT